MHTKGNFGDLKFILTCLHIYVFFPVFFFIVFSFYFINALPSDNNSTTDNKCSGVLIFFGPLLESF